MLNTLTKKRNEQKKKKGFTLIELIIVIAIIAILAAIAVPKFLNLTRDSKIKADVANAKTIESTITTAIATDKFEIPTGDTAKDFPIADYLQTLPKAKAIDGVFSATVDKNGKIQVVITGKDKNDKEIKEVVLPAAEESMYNIK